MTKKYSYYRDGVEIDESAALDQNGILRDGVTMRTRIMMRDSYQGLGDARADAAQYWRDNKDCLLVHDGSRNPLGLHKPGFRMLDNAYGETAKRRAYLDYQTDLERAYLTPGNDAKRPMVEDAADDDDDNNGVERATSDRRGRSVDQIAAEHRQRMSRIYDQLRAGPAHRRRCRATASNRRRPIWRS